MDEVGALQVGHALAGIQAHPQKRVRRQMPPGGSEVVRQAAVLHELKHQTYRRVLGAHTVQLDELWVGQLPVTHTRARASKPTPVHTHIFLENEPT